MADSLPSRPDNPPPTGAEPRRLAAGHEDLLVAEAPLLLVIHGQQLLTMRTPGRDPDLATGFLLGEGVIDDAKAVVGMTAIAGDREQRRVDELQIALAQPPRGLAKARLARTHELRSSCGVCGLSDPDAMLDELPPLLPGVPKLPAAAIGSLQRQLQQRQQLFAATGGCHGALLADAAGQVLGFGEDVGRHNALDKAIGAAATAGHDLSRAIAILSGRAGYDLVVKCLRVRIAFLVAVSAPSALAFDLCAAAGATLVGFARGDRHTVYCGPERLHGSGSVAAPS